MNVNTITTWALLLVMFAKIYEGGLSQFNHTHVIFCIPILTDSGNFYFLVKQIGHIDPLRDNNITRRSVKHNMFVEN